MARGQWGTRRLRFCLERWIADDQPDAKLQGRVIDALRELTVDPYPPWAAPVPASSLDMWIGDVPDTAVCVLYVLLPGAHEISFWSIDTL